MKFKKSYSFMGTITQAKGLLKWFAKGKKVRAIFSLTADEQFYDAPVGRKVIISGQILDMPFASLISPNQNLSVEDYEYLVKSLVINESVASNNGDLIISVTKTQAGWTTIKPIKISGQANNWVYRQLISQVVIEGDAIMSQSEIIL